MSAPPLPRSELDEYLALAPTPAAPPASELDEYIADGATGESELDEYLAESEPSPPTVREQHTATLEESGARKEKAYGAAYNAVLKAREQGIQHVPGGPEAVIDVFKATRGQDGTSPVVDREIITEMEAKAAESQPDWYYLSHIIPGVTVLAASRDLKRAVEGEETNWADVTAAAAGLGLSIGVGSAPGLSAVTRAPHFILNTLRNVQGVKGAAEELWRSPITKLGQVAETLKRPIAALARLTTEDLAARLHPETPDPETGKPYRESELAGVGLAALAVPLSPMVGVAALAVEGTRRAMEKGPGPQAKGVAESIAEIVEAGNPLPNNRRADVSYIDVLRALDVARGGDGRSWWYWIPGIGLDIFADPGAYLTFGGSSAAHAASEVTDLVYKGVLKGAKGRFLPFKAKDVARQMGRVARDLYSSMPIDEAATSVAAVLKANPDVPSAVVREFGRRSSTIGAMGVSFTAGPVALPYSMPFVGHRLPGAKAVRAVGRESIIKGSTLISLKEQVADDTRVFVEQFGTFFGRRKDPLDGRKLVDALITAHEAVTPEVSFLRRSRAIHIQARRAQQRAEGAAAHHWGQFSREVGEVRYRGRRTLPEAELVTEVGDFPNTLAYQARKQGELWQDPFKREGPFGKIPKGQGRFGRARRAGLTPKEDGWFHQRVAGAVENALRQPTAEEGLEVLDAAFETMGKHAKARYMQLGTTHTRLTQQVLNDFVKRDEAAIPVLRKLSEEWIQGEAEFMRSTRKVWEDVFPKGGKPAPTVGPRGAVLSPGPTTYRMTSLKVAVRRKMWEVARKSKSAQEAATKWADEAEAAILESLPKRSRASARPQVQLVVQRGGKALQDDLFDVITKHKESALRDAGHGIYREHHHADDLWRPAEHTIPVLEPDVNVEVGRIFRNGYSNSIVRAADPEEAKGIFRSYHEDVLDVIPKEHRARYAPLIDDTLESGVLSIGEDWKANQTKLGDLHEGLNDLAKWVDESYATSLRRIQEVGGEVDELNSFTMHFYRNKKRLVKVHGIEKVSIDGNPFKKRVLGSLMEADEMGFDPVKDAISLVVANRHAAELIVKKAAFKTDFLRAAKKMGLARLLDATTADEAVKAAQKAEDLWRAADVAKGQPVPHGGRYWGLHPDAFEAFTRFEKLMEPSELKWFGRLFDSFQNYWKTAVTVGRVGFHTRNAWSNLVLMYIGGWSGRYGGAAFRVGMLEHAIEDTLDLGQRIRKGAKRTTAQRGYDRISDVFRERLRDFARKQAGRSWTGVNGQTVTAEEFFKGAREHGVLERSWSSGEVPQDIMSRVAERPEYEWLRRSLRFLHMRRDGFIFRMGGKAGRQIENHARLTFFMDRVLTHGDDFETAARLVKQTLFDYQDLTRLDRKLFKRVMPFWTWRRKSIPAFVMGAVKRPGLASAPMKMKRMSEKAYRMYEEEAKWVANEQRSDYVRRMNGFPLPVGSPYDEDHGHLMMLSPDFGYSDVNTLATDDDGIMSAMSPLLKFGAEALTGRKSGVGRELGWSVIPPWMNPAAEAFGSPFFARVESKDPQKPDAWTAHDLTIRALLTTFPHVDAYGRIFTAATSEIPEQRAKAKWQLLGDISGAGRIYSLDPDKMKARAAQKATKTLKQKRPPWGYRRFIPRGKRKGVGPTD